MVDYLSENGYGFNTLFEARGGHPPLLKLFIKREIILETLIILDMVLFDRDWETA